MDPDHLKALLQALSLLSIPVSFVALMRTLGAQATDRTNKFSDRIYEIDKLTLQYPQLQAFLHSMVDHQGAYFVPDTPHTTAYFQLKAYIYYQLNFFDELLSIAPKNARLARALEIEDWNTYIIEKMRHPLFQELFRREAEHFGQQFRNFMAAHAKELSRPASREAF